MSLWQQFGDLMAASMGQPRALGRMLASGEHLRNHPFEPPRSIQLATALTHWQRWSEFGYKPNSRSNRVHGWYRDRDGQYRGGLFELPELSQLVRRTPFETWTGDIRDIVGISASKSPIQECESLEQFAERYCEGLIKDISEQQLKRCWAHERRFTPEYRGKLLFGQYGWDGRIFWLNEGGSHHFAAARYLAGKLDQPVEVKGKLVPVRARL